MSLILVVVCVVAAQAQQTAPAAAARTLSLDDALKMAEAGSETLAIARAGVDRADGERVRARADLFPQISTSASYDRALASEFSGIFDSIPDDDGGGTGDFEDLPFGRENTWRLNFSFSQNLFSGGRIGAQTAIADATRSTAEIGVASTRAQIALNVVSAYYDAALSERLLQIAEATYTQADATFAQTKQGYDAGSQPEFELLRSQVTRDNQRPVVIRRRSDRDLALLRLKQLLDIPSGESLALVDPLDGETLPPPPPFAASAAAAPTGPVPEIHRATIRQAESAVRLSEAAVEVARAQRRPTANVTSSYGEVAYPGGALPAFGDFRRNWTVGAIVQLPLLTGGRLRAGEVIARADAREAEAQLRQARELALLDSQSAYEELKAALAGWESSAGTVTQAARAYEIAELRYREGVSTQLELNDARLQLVQAQATRAQAARDVQVARARVALLPDLPLGSMTAAGAATPPATQPATAQQPAQTPVPAATPTTPGGRTTTGPGGL